MVPLCVRPVLLVTLLALCSHANAHTNTNTNIIRPAPVLEPQQSTDGSLRYSPPFLGPDTGILPSDYQLAIITSYLNNIKTTMDVFLRMIAIKDGDDEAQCDILKNIYPPMRVLLEAEYAHSLLNPPKVQNKQPKNVAKVIAKSISQTAKKVGKAITSASKSTAKAITKSSKKTGKALKKSTKKLKKSSNKLAACALP